MEITLLLPLAGDSDGVAARIALLQEKKVDAETICIEDSDDDSAHGSGRDDDSGRGLADQCITPRRADDDDGAAAQGGGTGGARGDVNDDAVDGGVPPRRAGDDDGYDALKTKKAKVKDTKLRRLKNVLAS